MDITSLIGIFIGALAVFGGAVLEGIPITSVLAPTAAIIVFGGTFGAVLLQGTQKELIGCIMGMKVIFLGVPEKPGETSQLLVDLALKARKEGILALQSDIAAVDSPFLKKGLELMTDGTDPALLRDLLETELGFFEDEVTAIGKLYESAGGFCPTVGIVGAVLGLIHVMSNLNDPAKLGAGIATAFVATIYGVGAANLVLIPMGGKFKSKSKVSIMTREMMIEGILSIQAGESPNFIEEKLKVFNPGAKGGSDSGDDA